MGLTGFSSLCFKKASLSPKQRFVGGELALVTATGRKLAENQWFTHDSKHQQQTAIINRPGVAGAVL